MTLLRLGIYCLLSFVPFWIILPRMNAFYEGPVYMSEAAEGAVYVLGIFGMLIPAAAHVCTRLVTKEGFRVKMAVPRGELWSSKSCEGLKLGVGQRGFYAEHQSQMQSIKVRVRSIKGWV